MCVGVERLEREGVKMAKIIDNLKQELLNEILMENEIDTVMEREKYLPIECDNEDEEGVLKYSNGKSEIWIKYIYSNGEYLVTDVTMKTKKSGSTKSRHLNIDEIKALMDYFRDKEKYDEFMIFVMELFLARRIGDTVSLEWEHFFYENGNKRLTICDLVEEKTEKVAKLHVADVLWKYIEWYCSVKNINPMDYYGQEIFKCEHKIGVKKYSSNGEYTESYIKANEKHEKAFRYQFNLATKALGIEGVTTHGIRKSFGNIVHKINQFDPDCLETLKTIYVHDSVETTKIYIDVIDEKAKKYFNDIANYVYEVDSGIEPCIDNIPVVALKTNDLRDVLLKAYSIGMENKFIHDAGVHMETMNTLISEVEKMRIK